MAKRKSTFGRQHEQGWSSDWKAMQNETDGSDGSMTAESDGLGDEMDAAFRRGRDYATKGYSLSTVKTASKKKPKEYRDEMLRGWKWQREHGTKKKPS